MMMVQSRLISSDRDYLVLTLISKESPAENSEGATPGI